MVQTHGLTHINLAVRDLGPALRFYEQVFGLREYGRGDGLVNRSLRHEAVRAGPTAWLRSEPGQSAAANRRPAGQSDSCMKFECPPGISTSRSAAVAELVIRQRNPHQRGKDLFCLPSLVVAL